MRKLLREPLLHFMLLGFGLFLLHGWVGIAASASDTSIVITQGRIEQLKTGFSRMHQREPNDAELKSMIDDAIREEILYREAKALGLDQDDTIVRRRLSQKLQFVSEDVASVPEPTDAQLQAFLTTNPDRFRSETRYSLSHVYLDPQQHGQRMEADTQSLLAALRPLGGGGDASKLGDAFLLGYVFRDVKASEVVRLFGARFETALRTLPTGQWQGPVTSGYGAHLVFIDERDDDRVAELDQVRDEVRRAWLDEQRRQANERLYADLRKRYDVLVEVGAKDRGAFSLAVERQQ